MYDSKRSEKKQPLFRVKILLETGAVKGYFRGEILWGSLFLFPFSIFSGCKENSPLSQMPGQGFCQLFGLLSSF